jgi:2'-5' RNA ligase
VSTGRGGAAASEVSAPRRFVAVGASSEVRARVERATARAREAAPDLRWTSPQGWHLTLAFLGPVRAPGLAVEAVRRAARATAPFELTTAAPGRFGRRVLWLGVDDPDGALATLAATVRAELARSDVEVAAADRPFTAHLTLARARSRRRDVTADDVARIRVPATVWPLTELGVWSSRGGGGYVVDRAEPLGG